jgi:hypothetical protein
LALKERAPLARQQDWMMVYNNKYFWGKFIILCSMFVFLEILPKGNVVSDCEKALYQVRFN